MLRVGVLTDETVGSWLKILKLAVTFGVAGAEGRNPCASPVFIDCIGSDVGGFSSISISSNVSMSCMGARVDLVVPWKPEPDCDTELLGICGVWNDCIDRLGSPVWRPKL